MEMKPNLAKEPAVPAPQFEGLKVAAFLLTVLGALAAVFGFVLVVSSFTGDIEGGPLFPAASLLLAGVACFGLGELCRAIRAIAIKSGQSAEL